MPPFRDGLKRKTDTDTKDLRESVENLELASGAVNDSHDEDDEDQEDQDSDDNQTDEVLFDSDVDSTLGAEDNSEQSSELDDEESDEESDGDKESDGDESSDGDSGTAVSDDDKQHNKKDNSPKKDSKNKKIEDSSRSKQLISKSDVNKSKNNKDNNKVKKITKKSIVGKEQPAVEKLAEQIQQNAADGADEYASGDTSDEEERINCAGDVPAWWYREYPHVGYDHGGRRVMRAATADLVDQFLRRAEDPDYWRTVIDPQTGQEIVLSTEDLQLLQTLRSGRAPGDAVDQYPPWIEWFSREVMATPLRAFPDHKRSFLPSRTEQKQISRLVHALNMGWIKTRKELAQERKRNKEKHFYDLWGSSPADETSRPGPRHIPAPRRTLPTHADSYRPPPEYLSEPGPDTPVWAPRSVPALRAVPAYPRYVRDRFLRCLDLYLAPRAIKMKLSIRPEDLVPSLPSPRDLRPFPSQESVTYRGHGAPVRSCCMSPCGQYAASASDDGTVRVWEVATGRCLRELDAGGAVCKVLWSPAMGVTLVAACVGTKIVLYNPGHHVGAHRAATHTDTLLQEPPPQHDIVPDPRVSAACTWEKVDVEQWARGVRLAVSHVRSVRHAAWHPRGDYLATVTEEPAARALLVHQLSRRRSQLPLSRHRGLVQCVQFHPTRPFLFVATQRNVRVYDLLKRELVKKLTTGAQWISSMAVHPGGDNLLVGSYDRKCVWFDLDLGSTPYQTLRLTGGAVRAVCHHARYPLWAAGGEGAVVCHGRVYADLTQSPLLVPLRRLTVPRRDNLSALDVVFHPTQPWLMVACADHTLRLYT